MWVYNKMADGNKLQAAGSRPRADKEIVCHLCHIPAGNLEAKTLMCKRCKKDYCIKCQKKDEVEYVILQNQNTGIMWFCPYCEESVEKKIAMEQMIEKKCQIVIQKIEQRMKEMENKLGEKCDETRVVEIIREQLIEQL